MRKFLTSLAAISLIGSLFLGAPASVAAAGTGSAKVYALDDGDYIHADNSREEDGARQTYLSPAGTTMNMQIELIEDGDDADLVDTITFSLKNAVFAGTYNDDNGYGAYDDGDYNDDACYLDWTSGNKTTTPTATITAYLDCNAGTGADGAPDQRTYLNFDVVIPAGGSAVLTVDSAAADVKVFFFAAEDADDIYVGSGSLPAASGDGNCTNPDFSTVNAAQGSAEEAIFAALAGVDQDTDTIIVCDGTFEYEADIEQYDGDDLYNGTLHIEADNKTDAILSGDEDSYQLLNIVDASLDVWGVKFSNGQAADGGAIYLNDGDLSIDDSSFFSNEAGEGGAVFLENGTIDVTDTDFTENTAYNVSGGAIKAYIDGDSSITSSDFYYNEADENGGAVSINTYLDDNDSDFTVDESYFESNEASFDGGAIRTGGDVMLAVDSSEFVDNATVVDDGGAIYAKTDATVGYSLFTGNHAGDEGGAIMFDRGADVDHSRFTRNDADDIGGAISADGRSFYSDSLFIANYSDAEAGALYAEDNTNIDDTKFINNRSANWGGAASFDDDAWLDGVVFRGNKSRKGGAVDSWGNRFYLTNSKFINNRATLYGGAIARGYDDGGVTLLGDVDRSTIFRANRSSVGTPVALYGAHGTFFEASTRLIAREAMRFWNAAGVQATLIRRSW